MYSEQIEKLIELALADGELTEKEKQILFKRAEAEGIDLDEFEMVLEARIFEKTKNKTTEPIAAPQSNKFGDIKKCPSCGAIVESFSTRCADCGHNFSGIVANSSINRLFDMLNDIESKRKDSSLTSLATNFFGKGFGLGGDKITSQKREIISSFPIPNSKEDILEFLALAIPKAKKKKGFFVSHETQNANQAHNEFVPVWKTKCEQIIMKARFSMKEDKKTLDEIEYYAKELGIK